MHCEQNTEFLHVKLMVHKVRHKAFQSDSDTNVQAAQCHTHTAASSQQRPEINKVILIDLFVEDADQSRAQMPQQLAYKLDINEDQLDGIFGIVRNACFTHLHTIMTEHICMHTHSLRTETRVGTRTYVETYKFAHGHTTCVVHTYIHRHIEALSIMQ